MKADQFLRFLPPGIFLFASVVALWRSRGFPEVTGGVPGPALVPVLLSLVLGLIGLVLFYQAWREVAGTDSGQPSDEAEPEKIPWLSFGILVGAIVAYLFLLPKLGFISSTTLFLVVCLYCFGYRGGIHAWAFAIVSAYILYGIFAVIMNVPLPIGWLG